MLTAASSPTSSPTISNKKRIRYVEAFRYLVDERIRYKGAHGGRGKPRAPFAPRRARCEGAGTPIPSKNRRSLRDETIKRRHIRIAEIAPRLRATSSWVEHLNADESASRTAFTPHSPAGRFKRSAQALFFLLFRSRLHRSFPIASRTHISNLLFKSFLHRS